MKLRLFILTAALVAAISFVAVGERLGSLSSNSQVLTPSSDIEAPSVTTKDGFPVFEIRVPDGFVEVQVRASLTNFEPGFLLKTGDQFVHNYIPTGVVYAGRKVYRALGTEHEARWDPTFNHWNIKISDNAYLTGSAMNPWDITSLALSYIGAPPPPSGPYDGVTFAVQKEYFVYRFCTTGIPSDDTWATGSGDPDAWVFFANQDAVPDSVNNTEFKRQKWNPTGSLASQLQAGGTPGYTILFQPSRGNLGASEWMQQNQDKLVWIYQVESPAGKPKHPNDTDVWNTFHPLEWRKARITLD